jgi:hypothetical protein
MTPTEAVALAGLGYSLVGVARAKVGFVGYEVRTADDQLIASFNCKGEEVDQLLGSNEGTPSL